MIEHIDTIMAVRDLIEHIDCTQVKDYEHRDDVLFVDVRNQEAFAQGHIPNALHCERGVLEFLVANGSPMQRSEFKEQTFKHCIVYCNGGRQSVLAAKTLHDMGVKGVKNLRGGYAEWCNQNPAQ